MSQERWQYMGYNGESVSVSIKYGGFQGDQIAKSPTESGQKIHTIYFPRKGKYILFFPGNLLLAIVSLLSQVSFKNRSEINFGKFPKKYFSDMFWKRWSYRTKPLTIVVVVLTLCVCVRVSRGLCRFAFQGVLARYGGWESDDFWFVDKSLIRRIVPSGQPARSRAVTRLQTQDSGHSPSYKTLYTRLVQHKDKYKYKYKCKHKIAVTLLCIKHFILVQHEFKRLYTSLTLVKHWYIWKCLLNQCLWLWLNKLHWNHCDIFWCSSSSRSSILLEWHRRNCYICHILLENCAQITPPAIVGL